MCAPCIFIIPHLFMFIFLFKIFLYLCRGNDLFLFSNEMECDLFCSVFRLTLHLHYKYLLTLCCLVSLPFIFKF